MDWPRAGAAIERRRAVRYTSREKAAAASGVAVSVWQQLETAKKDGYRRATLARVEHALGWPLGSIEAIADGGPIPESADDVAELRSRIEVVESKVDQILGQLGEQG